MEDTRKAAALVATVSALLIAGALVFEMSGYAACEMCMWQRWTHVAAAVLATSSLIAARMSRWTSAAALVLALAAMSASGAIGVFHAGVEWKLWEGLTTCSAGPRHGGGDVLAEIMKGPLVRCDEAAWRLMGISMAGYNAVISLGTAVMAAMTWRHDRPRRKGEAE